MPPSFWNSLHIAEDCGFEGVVSSAYRALRPLLLGTETLWPQSRGMTGNLIITVMTCGVHFVGASASSIW